LLLLAQLEEGEINEALKQQMVACYQKQPMASETPAPAALQATLEIPFSAPIS
jgi:hypothetical protein